MLRRTPRPIDVLVLSLPLFAGACGSVGSEPAASCPRCGDPRTVYDADGRPRVLTRLRMTDASVVPDLLLGLGPWATARDETTPAAELPAAK